MMSDNAMNTTILPIYISIKIFQGTKKGYRSILFILCQV